MNTTRLYKCFSGTDNGILSKPPSILTKNKDKDHDKYRVYISSFISQGLIVSKENLNCFVIIKFLDNLIIKFK